MALYRANSGREVALSNHQPPAKRLRMSRAIPLLPHCAFMACYGETFSFNYT
jgi:hypothetical protein